MYVTKIDECYIIGRWNEYRLRILLSMISQHRSKNKHLEFYKEKLRAMVHNMLTVIDSGISGNTLDMTTYLELDILCMYELASSYEPEHDNERFFKLMFETVLSKSIKSPIDQLIS